MLLFQCEDYTFTSSSLLSYCSVSFFKLYMLCSSLNKFSKCILRERLVYILFCPDNHSAIKILYQQWVVYFYTSPFPLCIDLNTRTIYLQLVIHGKKNFTCIIFMAAEEQVEASKKLKTQLYVDIHTKRKLKISISFPTQRKEIRKTMAKPACMFLLHTL